MKYMKVMDEKMVKVSRRIELATKLSTLPLLSSEPYLAANYGLGGYYSIHHDGAAELNRTVLTEEAFTYGDRFATVIGYLSDVQHGGSTVFPSTGVELTPVKNDVAVWFNLLRDGRRDPLMYHQGCPVLLGSKWIFNKWIRYNDQFQEFPCALKDEERFRLNMKYKD